MSAQHTAVFAIERWARRAPRTRWPLVLLAVLLLVGLAGGITGCGGGDEADEPACPTVGERFERSNGICPDPIGPPDCRARPQLCQ